MVDVWEETAQRRRWLADQLGELTTDEWRMPSWCSGWSVRDVAAHLVFLAEATRWSAMRDIIRHGVRPDPALARIARRMAALPTEELVRRLRDGAGGRFHAPGTPPAVALGEVLVHSADILNPLGRTFVSAPEPVVPVLDVYRRLARLAFHTETARKVRLVATDVGWAAGRGPEARG